MENTVSNPCLVESANTNSTNWLQSQKLSPDFLLCLVGPPTFQLCSSIHCTFKLYHPALSGGCWGSWVLFDGSRNHRNINQRTHGSQQEGKSQLTPAYLLLTTMQSVHFSLAVRARGPQAYHVVFHASQVTGKHLKFSWGGWYKAWVQALLGYSINRRQP